jgi:hypothetical protein
VDEAPADARAHLDEASARAAAEDMLVQALVRSVSAKLCAAAGHPVEARRLADEAAHVLERTDAICDRARIAVARARALELCGDASGATAALHEAHDLYEAKGSPCALRLIDLHGTRALT